MREERRTTKVCGHTLGPVSGQPRFPGAVDLVQRFRSSKKNDGDTTERKR